MAAHSRHSFGTCIIVGGTGALGVSVATWLAQSNSTSAHLTGRSGRLSAPLMAALRTTALAQAAVTVTMCDGSSVADGVALTTGAHAVGAVGACCVCMIHDDCQHLAAVALLRSRESEARLIMSVRT